MTLTLPGSEPAGKLPVVVLKPGSGNDYLPWLYTQLLQNIGGAKVCIILGKWFARHLFVDILWQNMDVIVWNI